MERSGLCDGYYHHLFLEEKDDEQEEMQVDFWPVKGDGYHPQLFVGHLFHWEKTRRTFVN